MSLTDSWVVMAVRKGDPTTLGDAQQLWTALETRSSKPPCLYRVLGTLPFCEGTLDAKDKVVQCVLGYLPAHLQSDSTVRNLLPVLVRIHWGCQEEDPVKNVLFYTKDQPNRALGPGELHCSAPMLPSSFVDSYWYLILRQNPLQATLDALRQCLRVATARKFS